jgi:hypothetical protein
LQRAAAKTAALQQQLTTTNQECEQLRRVAAFAFKKWQVGCAAVTSYVISHLAGYIALQLWAVVPQELQLFDSCCMQELLQALLWEAACAAQVGGVCLQESRQHATAVLCIKV